MKIIGCGGRHFPLLPETAPWRWVEAACNLLRITEIVDGGAPGADTGFHELATILGIDSVRFFANWVHFDHHAGPMRNRKQLQYLAWSGGLTSEPIAILALPGGRGTQNMITQAIAAGIEVFAPTLQGLLAPPATCEEVRHAHVR